MFVDYREGDIDRLARLIGEEVRLRRKALGMSSRRFATLAQTHHGVVLRLERGEQMPSLTTLAYWCPALGCSITDVLASAEQKLTRELVEGGAAA